MILVIVLSFSFQYITKLLLVLLDWVMVIPQETLLKNRIAQENVKLTYLGLVMKVTVMLTTNPWQLVSSKETIKIYRCVTLYIFCYLLRAVLIYVVR